MPSRLPLWSFICSSLWLVVIFVIYTGSVEATKLENSVMDLSHIEAVHQAGNPSSHKALSQVEEQNSLTGVARRQLLAGGGRPGFTSIRNREPEPYVGHTKVRSHLSHRPDLLNGHVIKPGIPTPGKAIKGGLTKTVKVEESKTSSLSVVLYWDRHMTNDNIKSALKAWDSFFKKHSERSKGLMKYKTSQYDNYVKSDVAVVFSSYNRHKSSTDYRKRLWDKQLQAGGRVLTIEMGFFKRDQGYYSASWDTGKDFDFCGVHFPYSGIVKHMFAKNMSIDRWRHLKLEDPKEYKEPANPDGPVVVLGQVPWDSQTQKLKDYWSWLGGSLNLMHVRTQKRIIYRPHPYIVVDKKDNTCYKWKEMEELTPCLPANVTKGTVEVDSKTSLQTLISKASVVVTYNSNSLLDALLEGIPAITISRCTPVERLVMHEITRENLNRPKAPDHKLIRQALNNLVYYQWNLDEIRSGEAWDFMRSFLQSYPGYA